MPHARSRALVAALVLAIPAAVHAASDYPTNVCVAKKLAAAATACRAIVKNDKAQKGSVPKLVKVWRKAERKATKAGVDCAETTATASELAAAIGSATGAFTGVFDEVSGSCRKRIRNAAAKACAALLAAESKLVAAPDEDGDRSTLGAARTQAFADLGSALSTLAGKGCVPTRDVAALTAHVADKAILALEVSPKVPTDWTRVDPPASVMYDGRELQPICAHGTPYAYWVRRGTVNKLLVYYEGGGACFDQLTCGNPVYDSSVEDDDNPGLYTTGLGDVTNPANPFRDWNAVFVSYCTGDIHWGDATVTYGTGPGAVTINHRGAVNGRVVEKWAREHFVAPDEVFVSGSSAGAYGAISGSTFLMEKVYRASQFNVVGDAGNGIVTDTFVQTQLLGWGIENNLPRWIPALDVPDLRSLDIADLWAAVANFYPRNRFAQYTSAFDGGSGSQTFFYNVMVNVADITKWLNWWEQSCDWNAKMRTLAQDTAARASNYRYYIGAGDRHTIWGSNKIYTDSKGGVPPFVDWVQAMRAGSSAWTNVECTDCSLLAEDSNPMMPPFNPDGSVSCPVP